MVKSNTIIMAVAMLLGLIFAGLPCFEAQSPTYAPMMSPGTPMAMTPAPDCMTALTNLSDCLTFVSIGSNLTTPDKPCCPEFAGLLESNPICLCSLIGSAESFGVDINRAMMLPKACKIDAPSPDACPATPGSAPTPSPSSEAPGSTAGGPGPGPDGSGAGMSPTASNGSGTSGASSNAVHDISTLFCLVAAIFIAYYF